MALTLMHRLELSCPVNLWVWDETKQNYWKKNPQKSWISRIFGSPQKVLLESKLQGNLILSQVNHPKDLLDIRFFIYR